MSRDLIPRRRFLRAACCLGTALATTRPSQARTTKVRVKEVRHDFEDFVYRSPLKFGGVTITLATMLNVNCVVRTPDGREVRGFGSMKMANVWSFRSRVLSYDDTLTAMRRLADRIAKITEAYNESAHPIDANQELLPAYLKAAGEVSRELRLPEPIPELCTLVTAAAFDAAIHDAFGKANGLNCYLTYGKDFLPHDLSKYLGPEFRGEYLTRYISAKPKERLPIYHLVGAADPITESDIKKRIGDGLPETLPEWIRFNGLTHLKIKMQGDDLPWDIDRVLKVHRAVVETQQRLGASERRYSLDFNEMCPNVDYLIEFLRQVREKAPVAFDAIQYIEQPTKRDLKADRANVMHEAAKLRPVVIDESLTDLESLMLAREMGYTGAALKTCKGQSKSLLMAAAAQKFKMFMSVQDSALPGAALVHSAGLAAHVPPVPAIEANGRQFMPDANKDWIDKFPGIFVVKDGTIQTGDLTRPGLSAVP